jgi:hypothetical protein
MPQKHAQISPDELIRVVAAQHKVLLKPDDPAFAIVSMNELVLNYLLHAVHQQLVDDLAAFHDAATKIQGRGLSLLDETIRGAARDIQREILNEVRDARIEARELVKNVSAFYERPLSEQKIVIVCLAAAAILLIGAFLGRMTL